MNIKVTNQVVIQARMGSTRLPGKTLLPLGGRPVIEHVIRRSSAAMLVDRVVVATTDQSEDDQVADWCNRHAIHCIRGSSADVLARYLKAISEFPCSNVIRITADCPLIDPGIIDALLCLHAGQGCDYTANVIPPTFPIGFDAEVIRAETLQQLDGSASLTSHREHVTLFIRENLARFKTANLSFGQNFENVRLTLDRDADFQLLARVFAHFASSSELFSFYQVMDFLSQNPELVAINSGIDRFEGVKKSAAGENRRLQWE
ncbi:MAG: glycosyltransferase family protein [Candidatus Riflebacteria bacterium]|nr:glycosyltransferase family protein [Candidatus Riflebacteria bacterium]